MRKMIDRFLCAAHHRLMEQQKIKPGLYRHFKGGVYRVLGEGKHSESLDPFVVYAHDGQLWLRPKAMFLETVERDGNTLPRFEYLGNEKLVRDRIPEIITAEGSPSQVRTAGDTEYRERLKEKLREEVDEFCQSHSAEELADILEVVAAVSAAFGLPPQEIERIMEEKREQRGAFDKRIILKM